MLYFKEGSITLLYIPFDTILTDIQQSQINDILFEYNLSSPNWDEYNDMFEGYIIHDDTYDKESEDLLTNDDDHVESYFNITSTHEDISQKLQNCTGISDIMVCTGDTCYCILPPTTC